VGLSAKPGFIVEADDRSHSGAKRLKGELPAGTLVAHKTGTGGTQTASPRD